VRHVNPQRLKKPREYSIVHNPTSEELEKIRQATLERDGHLRYYPWAHLAYRAFLSTTV
jgi:hypothetical protein